MGKISGLTILVTTYNESNNIRRCLDSVKEFAEKIIVVDSFSTDKTIEIAREYTDIIFEHEYESPARQKNWALDRIETEWTFIIDADEAVSPELAQKIESTMKIPNADGYEIKRRSYFFGRLINFCGWQRDFVLRLFKTRKGRYPDIRVHESIELKGEKSRIYEPLYHHTYDSFDQYFEKFGRYTTWAAEDLMAKGNRPTFRKLFFKPLGRFLRQYVLQAGFMDGKEGLILCSLSAFSAFTKYAKLWDMKRKKRNTP